MLHVVFFGANYNLFTATEPLQAAAVGWFDSSLCVFLFRFNHQLLFLPLGRLKSAAAVKH